MKITYRIYEPELTPMHGEYLMSQRGRGGYLILAVNNRGGRVGDDGKAYNLVILTVERVTRAEALEHHDKLWGLVWDKRAPKRRHQKEKAAQHG